MFIFEFGEKIHIASLCKKDDYSSKLLYSCRREIYARETLNLIKLTSMNFIKFHSIKVVVFRRNLSSVQRNHFRRTLLLFKIGTKI